MDTWDPVPGMGSITGDRCSSQARATCDGVTPVSFYDIVHGSARVGQGAGGDGEPRDEADPLGLAVVEHVLGRPVGQVVEVLQR